MFYKLNLQRVHTNFGPKYFGDIILKKHSLKYAQTSNTKSYLLFYNYLCQINILYVWGA